MRRRSKCSRATKHRAPITGCGFARAGRRASAWCCMTTMPRAADRSRSACSRASAALLLTDGYEAYNAAIAAHSLTHAGCWAHVRRKFEEARKVQAQSDSRARVALDYIGRL